MRDGADYRMGAMWLTDAEFSDFRRDFRNASQPRFANFPEKGRRRRRVYTAFIPAPDKPAGEVAKGARRKKPMKRTRRS